MQNSCCQYTYSVHVHTGHPIAIYLHEFLSADVEQTVQELEPEHEMYVIVYLLLSLYKYAYCISVLSDIGSASHSPSLFLPCHLYCPLLHFRLQRKDKVPVILATPPSSTKTSPKILGKTSTNTYTQMPSRQGEEGAPSIASSSPWNQKRRLENNRGSCSTLNSGSVAQQSQDSFIKKSEILSTGSDYHSLQSSQQEMQSYRTTSRDSLMHKRKIPNPSISSGGSGSTEMTGYGTQSTCILSPPVEEVGNKRENRMASGPNECPGATYIDV